MSWTVYLCGPVSGFPDLFHSLANTIVLFTVVLILVGGFLLFLFFLKNLVTLSFHITGRKM